MRVTHWVENRAPFGFFRTDTKFDVMLPQLLVTTLEVVDDQCDERGTEYHRQTYEYM